MKTTLATVCRMEKGRTRKRKPEKTQWLPLQLGRWRRGPGCWPQRAGAGGRIGRHEGMRKERVMFCMFQCSFFSPFKHRPQIFKLKNESHNFPTILRMGSTQQMTQSRCLPSFAGDCHFPGSLRPTQGRGKKRNKNLKNKRRLSF